jgi:hypothetical protein
MLVLPRAAYRLNSHEANTADDRSHLDKRQRARALSTSLAKAAVFKELDVDVMA